MPLSTSPSKRLWRFVRRRLPCDGSDLPVAGAHRNKQDLKHRNGAEGSSRKSKAQLEKALRELQFMIDTIPAMVVTYQPDGTRDFVNQIWQDYSGLGLEDTTGERGGARFRHFHPDDAEAAANARHAALASGMPHLFEGRLRRHDGKYRWHAIRRVPLRDAMGNIAKWYAVGFDIEDKKIAEEALRRSEAELARAEGELVDSPVGLSAWMIDHDVRSQEMIARVFEGKAEGLTRDDVLDNVTLRL